MIGSNELQLNEATMIEAIQYWLDNKVLNKDEPRPVVTSVKLGSTYDNYFKIGLEQVQ